MHSLPDYPRVDAVDDLLSGHLWLLEAVDGGPVRFRLRADGRLAFAARSGPFDGDVPPHYRATVRHVRDHFDRNALRAAVDDPTAVTFQGVATFRRRIDYEFDRLPPFLGVEVHDGDRFLGPDAVEGIYERLGLAATPALDREVRAVDFDPERYEPPGSAYRDGPPLGILVRNKTGSRGAMLDEEWRDGGLWSETVPTACGDPIAGDPEAVARELVTDRLVDRTAGELGETAGDEVPFDSLFDAVLAATYREHAHRLAVHGADVDSRAFRSAVAEVVRERR